MTLEELFLQGMDLLPSLTRKEDIKKQLNNALETGDVVVGSKKTIKTLLYGEPKMVILANNCPRNIRETISYYCSISKTPFISIKESSLELGSGIGSPFPVSSVAILSEGESTILEAIK